MATIHENRSVDATRHVSSKHSNDKVEDLTVGHEILKQLGDFSEIRIHAAHGYDVRIAKINGKPAALSHFFMEKCYQLVVGSQQTVRAENA